MEEHILATEVAMRAREIMRSLPVFLANEPATAPFQQVMRDHLPGVVAIDPRDQRLIALSIVDLVRLLLPGYMSESPAVAAVFGEEAADTVAERMTQVSLGQLIGEHPPLGAEVSADATLAEIADTMNRSSCSVLLIRGAGPPASLRSAPVVTAAQVLEAMIQPFLEGQLRDGT